MRANRSLPCLPLLLGLAAAGLGLPSAARAEEPVKVTVVAILATDQNTKVDACLAGIAKEVQKLEPKLTGFQLHRQTCRPIALGGSEEFPLADGQTLSVRVERAADKNNRACLKVKPPELGEIVYSCTCGKFVPIVTRYRTKKNERLIVAVMCKSPAPKKK